MMTNYILLYVRIIVTLELTDKYVHSCVNVIQTLA